MRYLLSAATFTTAVAIIAAATSSDAASAPTAQASPACPALLDQKFKSLQGQPQNFCQYAGKVVVVVNTASYCGFTEQYKGLQAIYEKYKEKGLVVVGFPANDFGKQEPGSNAEVADFCERTYKVKFPMMEKTFVVEAEGVKVNPLHEALFKVTGQRPKWNFHKYVIGRDGQTVQSFGSSVNPESPAFLAALEKQLEVK